MAETVRRPLYFGCGDRAGHFLWTVRYRKVAYPYRSEQERTRRALDGGYPPSLGRRHEVPQGHAQLTLLPCGLGAVGDAAAELGPGPVTVLAFWDRSVDRRPGSHSTFLLPGDLDFGDALDAARDAFPWVFARLPFAVVPWKESP